MMNPEQNPYSFIVGDESSRGVSKLGGRPAKQKILMIAALFGGILIAILLLFSLVIGRGDDNAQQLTSLAQRQAEIIRVSEIGEKKARGQAAKNLAITTRLSLQSAQSDLLKVLEKKGRKLDVKSLTGMQNTRTDQTLDQAEQNNRFDEVFTEQIGIAVGEYRKAAEQAFNNASSKSEKEILASLFNQAKLLPPGNN